MWEILKSLSPAGRIGATIGLLGALAGATAAIVIEPVVGTILVVAAFGIVILAFWLAWRPHIQRNRLVKQGATTWATVVNIRETGWTVQGNYGQARLRLNVEPADGGPAYEVETRALINRFEIPQFQPGTRLQVVVDPRNRHKVAVL